MSDDLDRGSSPHGHAPGAPGIPPRWTSSAKSAVGTSIGASSRVWFTTSHGIVDEIYYPRIDTACVRDFGLLISPAGGGFLEEKRDARTVLEWLEPGVPAFRLINDLPGCRVTKQILTDPVREVFIQQVVVESDQPVVVTALLAPHMENRGSDNVGWVADFKGVPMMFAHGGGTTLALAADCGWAKRSVGYVGFSDAWQDLDRHGRMTWTYTAAGPGNVALGGEIAVPPSGRFTLALGFGRTDAEAALRARASLAAGFDASRSAYAAGWRVWHASTGRVAEGDLDTTSRTVLRVHESISFPGATIASLSIPWGFTKGDEDMGGYHLVWPRDMVGTLGGLLACNANDEALRGLDHLRASQEADGHWAQNMWLDGSPHWTGVQMDETALPILAVGLCRQEGLELDVDRYWTMVESAAGFLVANGPVTGQDRWEEDAGYSPFTVAAQIAALVVAADIAEHVGKPGIGAFLRDTADAWNDSIESWMYVSHTELSDAVGVDGYYVRIAPPEVADGASPATGWVPIKNRPPSDSQAPAAEVVSPDALALVRFGLRAAHDQRILDTVAVIDHLLRTELPGGPAWRRYTDDGYGEHADGSPFDGIGIGRPWPLLTGERAHYELAAGNRTAAEGLKATLQAFAGPHGLLPEQLWDTADLPERELFTGRASGSAMPLVWAHAEYLKLVESLRRGRVFDTPREAVARYGGGGPPAPVAIWSPNQKIGSLEAGKGLRLHLPAAATVRWTMDGWATWHDTKTAPILTVHVATLAVDHLPPGAAIEFTLHTEDGWEGLNHHLTVS